MTQLLVVKKILLTHSMKWKNLFLNYHLVAPRIKCPYTRSLLNGQLAAVIVYFSKNNELVVVV